MMRVQDFIADPLRGGTTINEVGKKADIVDEEKLLKMSAIYEILKPGKAGENTDEKRCFNPI
jgi:hypothetical protein